MQKIKLGIVGFGFMGHCDADMMKTFQNIDLVVIARPKIEDISNSELSAIFKRLWQQISHRLEK